MGMSNTIQQLSVFMENREGRLDEILKILSEAGVNIVALSLADTSEYGMLRMIVSDPHKGRAALKDEGITAMLTDSTCYRLSQQSNAPDCRGRSKYRVYVCICQRKRCCSSA